MALGQRVLGRSGLRVSDACLGTMTFGTSWGFGADESTSKDVYTAFREAGGNFLDTANNYTEGESEQILGRLIAGHRDEVVLSTKYTLATAADANGEGNHRKSLRRSVETSLRRLGTDHLDLLYVHVWDQHTPFDETMRALDDLVRSGKVLALGISNTPAWVVAGADVVAELRGWARLVSLQVEYSAARRTAERELLPMARTRGMHVAAWSPLARGLLAGKAQPVPSSDADQTVLDEASKVAAELGVSTAQVALAWVWHHDVTPVLGARTVEQVQDNLAAADLELSADQLHRLDAAGAIALGYPHDFVNGLFPQFTADGGPRRRVRP